MRIKKKICMHLLNKPALLSCCQQHIVYFIYHNMLGFKEEFLSLHVEVSMTFLYFHYFQKYDLSFISQDDSNRERARYFYQISETCY